jgi:hypothetical protein
MGFLRFVLESEGYDVVAQAASAGELARVLAVHRPDVVVLDDGIGATAVQMTHDVSPGAKVILVWPGAVVPVGGYARVDPDDVLRSLGPTVARAVGTMAAPRESVIASDWTDRVRKDPADLREGLEEHDALPGKHPSVTELRRRGQHLHPVADPRSVDAGVSSPDAAETVGDPAGQIQGDDLAPVLPLSALSMPPAAWASTMGESAAGPITTGEGATAELAAAGAGDWNRRLGVIALGGAVAASAVVIALALGGSGGHQGILSAAGFVQEPPAAAVPAPGASLIGGLGQAGLFSPTAGVIPVPPSGPLVPGNGGSNAGGGGSPGGAGSPGGGGTGGGGGSPGGGGVSAGSPMPGRSALHNPFGGPPGQILSPAKGPNRGGSHGNSAAAHEHGAQRGNSSAHASQNGQSHRHKR